MCAQFPRIVNRLVACWTDPQLTVGMRDQFFIAPPEPRRRRKNPAGPILAGCAAIVAPHRTTEGSGTSR
ncbi:MAG TPA: hypothetical protein VGM74_22090 [Burkholderiaceae bacterium]